MINVNTFMIFGYKLNNGASGEIRETNKALWKTLNDNELLHSLSNIQTSGETFLGVIFKNFPKTDSSFSCSITELNTDLANIDKQKLSDLEFYANLFRADNLIKELPQIYLLNQILYTKIKDI